MRPCEKICCISWMCCKKLRDKKESKKLKIYATLGFICLRDASRRQWGQSAVMAEKKAGGPPLPILLWQTNFLKEIHLGPMVTL